MSSSWRVFSSWLDVVKGFFLERIEDGEDSLIIQHCCRLWTSITFYVAELSSAFFYSEYTVDLARRRLTIVCFTCMESSFDCMIWVYRNSFQMQMDLLESTPDPLPA